MADNEGAYVTYKELLERLYPSQYVSEKSEITLSNKVGDVFEYADNTFTLAEGDILCQDVYGQTITVLQTGPDRITLDDGSNIVEGTAYVFRATKTVLEFHALRLMAMQTVDLYTGQWFNKRTLTVEIEGNNSHMLHFGVPIIEITSLKINDSEDEYDTNAYKVYNSRILPDDRRNPKIKIVSRGYSIYTYMGTKTVFYKGRFSTIEGSFGFLEADGSTPDLIKWATAKIVMNELTRDISASGSSAVIKKEKTDLHEIEYETGSNTSQSAGLQSKLTGDDSVDRILLMYKAPFAIGGTDPFFSTIENYYYGWNECNRIY